MLISSICFLSLAISVFSSSAWSRDSSRAQALPHTAHKSPLALCWVVLSSPKLQVVQKVSNACVWLGLKALSGPSFENVGYILERYF